MPNRSAEYLLLHQFMERAWLMMALIGCALSDHPLVRPIRANRHCVDRARKALFDLYKMFEAEAEGIAKEAATEGSAWERREGRSGSEDDFGAELLRLKGTVPKSVALEFGGRMPEHPTRRPRRRRKHKKI